MEAPYNSKSNSTTTTTDKNPPLTKKNLPSQSLFRRASDFAATAFLGSNPENIGGINHNGYVTRGVPLFGQKKARVAQGNGVPSADQKVEVKEGR